MCCKSKAYLKQFIDQNKTILGIDKTDIPSNESKEITVTVKSVKYIDIDGNTYVYLIDTENNIYKAKASEHESLLLVEVGNTVKLSVSGDRIIKYVS